MRFFNILAAYAAASGAAMVVLMLFGWIDSGSLSLDRIGYIAPLFAGGAASGALYALPIAVPTILFTEITRISSAKIFLAAGLATSALMFAMLSDYSHAELIALRTYVWRDIVVITAVCVAASLTYWFVAWKVAPPAPRAKSEAA
ncbi:MAG: hypothetical protein AAF692_08790 [Pseudomonadota bacterium]